MTLESTQPLTEMSTRNLLRVKGGLRVRRLYRKYRSLDVSQFYGPSWPVTGIGLALPFIHHLNIQRYTV
jgi:hypothetical protein